MAKRKYEFKEDDKVKVLLWCGRHCCLCGKFTGVGIEVAHLDPKISGIDNAIPLCFDCHASVGHYNKNHPRGRKYSINELKARRDQVYEQHTRHLVSPIEYKLTQKDTSLPKVRFYILNLGSTYPVKARIEINLYQGNQFIGHPQHSGHYNGSFLWNLNPQFVFNGWFKIPSIDLTDKGESLRAKIEVKIIDIYDRGHKMLPGGFIYNIGSEKDWYFEPSIEEFFQKTNDSLIK